MYVVYVVYVVEREDKKGGNGGGLHWRTFALPRGEGLSTATVTVAVAKDYCCGETWIKCAPLHRGTAMRAAHLLPISTSNSVSRSFSPSLSPVLRRLPLVYPSSTLVYPSSILPSLPLPHAPCMTGTKSITVSPSSPGSTTTRTMNSSSCSHFSTHSAASMMYVPSRSPLSSLLSSFRHMFVNGSL